VADYPAPQSASAGSTAPITAGVLAYALFAIAAITTILSAGFAFTMPLFCIFGIVGVIICYVKRDDAAGTWVASHFTWLIRTFWWSFLWAVIATIIIFTLGLILIGIPIAFAIWFFNGIWVVYRVVKGYLMFKDSRPIPGV
jgi:uncharacterized membrane protein